VQRHRRQPPTRTVARGRRAGGFPARGGWWLLEGRSAAAGTSPAPPSTPCWRFGVAEGVQQGCPTIGSHSCGTRQVGRGRRTVMPSPSARRPERLAATGGAPTTSDVDGGPWGGRRRPTTAGRSALLADTRGLPVQCGQPPSPHGPPPGDASMSTKGDGGGHVGRQHTRHPHPHPSPTSTATAHPPPAAHGQV